MDLGSQYSVNPGSYFSTQIAQVFSGLKFIPQLNIGLSTGCRISPRNVSDSCLPSPDAPGGLASMISEHAPLPCYTRVHAGASTVPTHNLLPPPAT